jgi:tetratricopeptide (TPR) repeat protein
VLRYSSMLRSLYTFGLSLALATMCTTCAVAANVETSSFDERLLADAQDGELGQFDLLSACLIAGGVSDAEELAKQRRLLIVAIDDVLGQDLVIGTAAERAEVLWQRLHAEVLTGRYDKEATDLRRVMATGDFNCLSATVLFGALCERANIPVEYWSQPGHVYCRLSVHGQRIEAASRQWGAATHSLHASAPARRITPVQLVGKFYYNRGVEQLQRREFERGIASLRRASQLDPLDGDARANLLAGLNNWALALVEQDQPAAAAALIGRGLLIDPSYAPLVANQRYLAERVRASHP